VGGGFESNNIIEAYCVNGCITTIHKNTDSYDYLDSDEKLQSLNKII
jgi:hypothetical protein